MSFSKSSRPRRPGAYVNYDAAPQASFSPSQGSIVAISGTHNWGPYKTPTLVSSYDAFKAIYGTTASELQTAVGQAFKGEAVLNRGGAGAVLVCRWGGSAGAKATKTINNTAGSPVAAITLTAKYEGTFGNGLRVTTRDHASDAAKNELLILNGTVLLETFVYADTDITALAAEINLLSDWVTAGSVVTGTSLATLSGSAFTGGNDGTTMVGGDWTDIMSALSISRFGIFAPANLTDGTILASVVAWQAAAQNVGLRFMTVVGGAADDDATDAATRALTINDPNVVCLGVGNVTDSTWGTLSTAQLAPRIAGIMAARGDSKGLSFARLGGITALTGGVDPAQIDTLYDTGVTVLYRDGFVDAPVRIDKGLTSFSTTTDTTRPHNIFSNPKFVRTMQMLEDEVYELTSAPGFLGELTVNDQTRTWAVGEIKRLLLEREKPERGALQPGSTVQVDQDPPPSDDDEFIALRIGLRFGRDAEQFFLSITVA